MLYRNFVWGEQHPSNIARIECALILIEGVPEMSDAVVLVDDLFFQAKLLETAKQVGITLSLATTGEQLLALAAAHPSALVIVDLNARQGSLAAISRIASEKKDPPRRIVAFLSHVQVDLAERARAAGCADVMARSQFTQNLATILQGAKA
jgi:DNA-binding NarL/FixJ family response regulator